MARQPYSDPREPDPRFPNRPTHPDFAVLSDAIQEIDGSADDGQTVDEILGDVVDVESLMYIVMQQAERAAPSSIGARTKIGGAMLAGFALGVRFAQQKEGT